MLPRDRPGGFTGGRTGKGASGLRVYSSAKLFQRTLCHQTAAMDDGEVAAKPFDNFEHVGSKENRGAASNHALKHGLEGAGRNSVHAFERLVEKKNSGAVNYGGGEREFLLHSVRVVGDEGFWLVGKLHEIEKLSCPLSGSFPIEAIHAAHKIQVFSAGKASK